MSIAESTVHRVTVTLIPQPTSIMRKLVHEIDELCACEMHVLDEWLSERCVLVLWRLLVVLFVYTTFGLLYFDIE